VNETRDEAGGRELTAAEANALAQELNDRAAGREPGTVHEIEVTGGSGAASEVSPSQEAATQGSEPLGAEEREANVQVYPPDITPTVDVGGSPEARAALEEEYRQDNDFRREP
jgi:hypothetical protein